jgi:hypothetical protein
MAAYGLPGVISLVKNKSRYLGEGHTLHFGFPQNFMPIGSFHYLFDVVVEISS